MNIRVLQDSIHFQNEVKDVLVEITKDEDEDPMRKHQPSQSTEKQPRLEEAVSGMKTVGIVGKKTKPTIIFQTYSSENYNFL